MQGTRPGGTRPPRRGRWRALASLLSVAKSCPTSVTPWTVARQAPLSVGFSRQEHSFSRGSSRPTDRTCVSCVGRWTLGSEPAVVEFDAGLGSGAGQVQGTHRSSRLHPLPLPQHSLCPSPMHTGKCSSFPGRKTTPQRMWSVLSKCLLFSLGGRTHVVVTLSGTATRVLVQVRVSRPGEIIWV